MKFVSLVWNFHSKNSPSRNVKKKEIFYTWPQCRHDLFKPIQTHFLDISWIDNENVFWGWWIDEILINLMRKHVGNKNHESLKFEMESSLHKKPSNKMQILMKFNVHKTNCFEGIIKYCVVRLNWNLIYYLFQ